MKGTITDRQHDALCDTAWVRHKNRAPFRYGYAYGLWKNAFWSRYQIWAHLHAYCHETRAYTLQLVGPYPDHDKPVAFFLKLVDDELARRAAA